MKNTRTGKKIAIIGSGIAGLSAAIRLRQQGHEVHVFEQNNYVGGKLTQITQKGYRFDAGPSLFTMPQFFEELFAQCGKRMQDYIPYQKQAVICHYFFADGTRFQAAANKEDFAKQAAETFHVSAQKIRDYSAESELKYNRTANLFLKQSLHKWKTYLSVDTIKAIAQIHKLGISSTLHKYNQKKFTDPRLVQFYDRFATYNGSNPYKTPGIMSMIPHLEQHFGTYYPIKGMHSLTEGLHALATELGVTFHLNSAVTKISVEKHTAKGIEVNSKFFAADVVVSNSDVVPTYRNLLKDQKAPEKVLQQERSSSALIFYWGIRHTFSELDLHNIFFSANYQEEFAQIFDQKIVPTHPTVYVNISAKETKTDAPAGCENWFVMVNVPSDTGQDWEQFIPTLRTTVIEKLSSALGQDISALIETEDVLTPTKIAQQTSSYQGALYGAASNDQFAAFLRHPNFSQQIKNLYFCGGSVHPGGGIPLCMLSGKIVADLI